MMMMMMIVIIIFQLTSSHARRTGHGLETLLADDRGVLTRPGRRGNHVDGVITDAKELAEAVFGVFGRADDTVLCRQHGFRVAALMVMVVVLMMMMMMVMMMTMMMMMMVVMVMMMMMVMMMTILQEFLKLNWNCSKINLERKKIPNFS